MKFTINGTAVEVPNNLQDAPLLDYIRDYVGLKGTKFGCGIGLCGACTIHVDGVAERSCQLSVNEVVDRQITTIEGLAATAPNSQLHPVQAAWIEDAVPQCGYCQAGQIMTAAAFLSRVSKPTDKQIREEMSGNLCRCGTYTRIRQAINRVANEAENVDNS